MINRDEKRLAVIVGAADCRELPDVRGALLIAADGGLKTLESRGLAPDFILGDFDSLGRVPAGENVFTYPPEKDDTDLMLAAKLALSKGAKLALICGALGGREDHSFATLTALAWLSRRGVKAAALGDGYAIFALTDGNLRLPGVSGTVSVFAFGGRAEGVKLAGLKYSYEGELDPFFPLGVSNEARGEPEISVASGTLLIYASLAAETARAILEENDG